MSTVEQDKEKIAKMPRKELNAEVLHCWREQDEQVKEIATLKKALKESCHYLRQADELIQDSGQVDPEDEEPGYLPSVVEWEKLCS